MERQSIDMKRTGRNIRVLMDKKSLSVKDIRRELGLGSLQSVYHWLHGRSLPTIDNLYELSALLKVPMDVIICGNRVLDEDKKMDDRKLPVISSREFHEELDAGTVFDTHGDTLQVTGVAADAIAMAPEEYDRTKAMVHDLTARCQEMNGRIDELTMAAGKLAEDMKKMEEEQGDPDIKYYIYEFEAEEQVWERLNEIAAEREMTLNELFIWTLENSLIHRPEEYKITDAQEEEKEPPELLHLTLIRQYPVYKWETELQAKRRKIEEEREQEKKESDDS